MNNNSEDYPLFKIGEDYYQTLKDDNLCYSMLEIQKMSSTRLVSVDVPDVIRKVKFLIDSLDSCLDIRAEDVIRLDTNMPDCVEVRFSARKDIKVNVYVENDKLEFDGIPQPDYDEDEMYLSYKQNNRRCIRHGSMLDMVKALKDILNET